MCKNIERITEDKLQFVLYYPFEGPNYRKVQFAGENIQVAKNAAANGHKYFWHELPGITSYECE